MAEKVRFHLDENVDYDVASGLRRHGIDVTTTSESGLSGASDDIQWDFVFAQRRVLVTYDPDFLRLTLEKPDHFGVVYSDKGTRSIGEMIRGLVLVHQVLEAKELHGRVEFI